MALVALAASSAVSKISVVLKQFFDFNYFIFSSPTITLISQRRVYGNFVSIGFTGINVPAVGDNVILKSIFLAREEVN